MAARLLLFNIDDKCLGFAVLFAFINFISFRLVDNWISKIVVSSMCLFFVFLAFVLDAWLSFVKDEEWKAKNLSYEPTEHPKEKT